MKKPKSKKKKKKKKKKKNESAKNATNERKWRCVSVSNQHLERVKM